METHYAEIPAVDVYNACDPGDLYPVMLRFKERWWSHSEYREQLRTWFIELFDAETGHYSRLRKSIEESGVKDPIVVTSGKPLRREAWMLPPDVGDLLCEQCGGSRLMIAQELLLTIPCIVNDRNNRFPGPDLSIEQIRAHFSSKSYDIRKTDQGVQIQPRTYSHMPSGYTFRDQQLARRKVWAEMIRRSADWDG